MSGHSRGLCDWTLLETHSMQDAKEGMHRQGCNGANMSMTKPMCNGSSDTELIDGVIDIYSYVFVL